MEHGDRFALGLGWGHPGVAVLILVASMLGASHVAAQEANPPDPRLASAPAPDPASRYHKHAMMQAGIGVTIAGAVLLAGGAAAFAGASSSSSSSPGDNVAGIAGGIAGVTMLSIGAAHVLVGVPLIAVGAQPAGLTRNPRLRNAGAALTSIGIVTIVAGGVVGLGLYLPADRDGRAFWGPFDWSLLGVGAGLAAIGVPLWVVGAQPPRPGVADASPSRAIPSIAPGARSIRLAWTF